MKKLVIVKGKNEGVCSAAFCTNKTQYTLCSTCRARKSRLADPVRYAYNNLKNRAKQRKIVFTITLDQFREFCIKTKYMAGKGKTAYSYTIDRKHEDIGYHADNLQVLISKDNIKKYYLNYDWRTKEAIVWKPLEAVRSEDDFFNSPVLKKLARFTTLYINN